MKLLTYMKDGGPESRVAGFFFAEIKSLFSVVLLHFFSGSREAYHDHAFDAISWVLKGELHEYDKNGVDRYYAPSLRPIYTPRSKFHKVVSLGDTWVLSFRGPWVCKWHEYLPNTQENITLTHGRQRVS